MVHSILLDPYPHGRLTTSLLHVETQTVRTASGLDFGTARVAHDDGAPRDTLMMVQPWSQYCERPDILQQLPLFAEATGKDVVMIDHLGIGVTTSPVPRAMSRDLRRGNFAPLIEEQQEVLQMLRLQLGRLSLLGYSEGSNLAAAYAAAMSGDALARLTLLETVSFDDHSLVRMVGRFAREAVRKYTEPADEFTNFKHTQVAPGEVAVTMRGLYDYPRGIANSSIADDLTVAYERGAINATTQVRIVNGARSFVSPTGKNEQLAERAEALGADDTLHVVLAGETHAIRDYPTVVQSLEAFDV